MHASAWSRIEHWVATTHTLQAQVQEVERHHQHLASNLQLTKQVQFTCGYGHLWSMDVYGWFGQEMVAKQSEYVRCLVFLYLIDT